MIMMMYTTKGRSEVRSESRSKTWSEFKFGFKSWSSSLSKFWSWSSSRIGYWYEVHFWSSYKPLSKRND